ncbi:MAG: sigma-70 family RNA polymerase sigma factor [Alphaproteobacteria bacterium]|nr:sigma-70 family RNA polymerase sigma factor [Alphaproteobacteria bacterium]
MAGHQWKENNLDKEDIELAEKMRRAQAGDGGAYAALLKELIPILKGFLYSRLGNRADNEDILQNALLAIHRSSHTYNTERSFKAWMFSIAEYKVKDFLRAHYRHAAVGWDDFDSVKDFIAAPVTEERGSGEDVQEMLKELPEKSRRIVYMMKVDDFSAAEVAEKLGMSVSAVKVAAHRAYKTLLAKGRPKRNQDAD